MDRPKNYGGDRISLNEAELALRQALMGAKTQELPTLQALCVGLLGVCEGLQKIRDDNQLIANRLSVIARELQIDPTEYRPRKLEGER